MGKDKAPKIDKLISKIPKDQIELLREIWEHFLKNKEWPKGRPFRKDRRSIVEKLIADLGPIFIWHYNKDYPAKEYYRLTTEGVYAVEGIEGASIKLILSYLDYLRKKFDEKPDFEEVTAQELKEKCHINSEETRILGELLDMGNTKLWGSHASGLGTSDWKAGVIKDIEDLYEKGSQEFLYKQWDEYIKWIITHRSNKVPGILGSIESQIGGLAMNFRNEAEGTAFEYDVFICHASEDKESFVRELAETLISKGLRVWYDEFTLSLGDSLRRSIDKGLVKSRYGVVVLSENFFRKNWPQREFDGLVARENGLDKVILPIWHGVTKEVVQSYSPILADRLAASTDKGLEYVVGRIFEVIRPEKTVKNKKANDIEEPDKVDPEEVKNIAKDYAKKSFSLNKIEISKINEESGIYEVEGNGISGSGVYRYFTLRIDAKTREIKGPEVQDSPWTVY